MGFFSIHSFLHLIMNNTFQWNQTCNATQCDTKEAFDVQAPTYPVSIKDLIQSKNKPEVKGSYLNEPKH